MRSRFLKPVIGGVILSVGLALFSHKPGLAEEVVQPKPEPVAAASANPVQRPKIVEWKDLRDISDGEHHVSSSNPIAYSIKVTRKDDYNPKTKTELDPSKLFLPSGKDYDRPIFSNQLGLEISCPNKYGAALVIEGYGVDDKTEHILILSFTNRDSQSGSPNKLFPINIFDPLSQFGSNNLKSVYAAVEEVVIFGTNSNPILSVILIPNKSELASRKVFSIPSLRLIFENGEVRSEGITLHRDDYKAR